VNGSESVKLVFSADTSDLVQSMNAAAQANVKVETSTERAARALKRQGEASDGASRSTRRHKEEARGLGREMGGLGGALDKAATSAKAMVAGYVGFVGIQKVARVVRQEIELTHQAMDRLGQAGRTIDEAAKRLANQRAQAGQRPDYAGAEKDIRSVMEAGRLSDVATAQNILLGANIPWGTPEGKLEVEQAKVIAEFGQRYALKADEVTALPEILNMMQVKTPAETKRTLEQIWAAQQASAESNFGQFVRGVAKMAPGFMAAGSSRETTLTTMVGARGVTPSTELAATLAEQTLRGMYRKDVQEAIAKEKGMGREAWMGQPFEARYSQVGQWIGTQGATPAGQMALGEALPAEQLVRLQAMYSGRSRAFMAEKGALIGGITPDVYEGLAGAYAQTTVAKREEQRSKTARGPVGKATGTRTGYELKTRAYGIVEEIRQGITPEELTPEEAAELRRGFWMMGTNAEVSATAGKVLSKRLQPLAQQAEAAGDIRWQESSGVGLIGKAARPSGYVGTTDVGQQVVEALAALQQMQATGAFVGHSAEQIGRLDTMIAELQGMREKLESIEERGSTRGGENSTQDGFQ